MNNNNEEQTQKSVPIGAVMAKLKLHTEQRNDTGDCLKYANNKLRASNEQHIATLGRLFKYEGQPIIDEAFEYAKKAGLFISCDSKYLGLKTKICPYKNKKGQTAPAHYTLYGHFLEMAKDGDQEPKFYKGNFLYQTHAQAFEKYRKTSVESFVQFEDLFDFTEKPTKEPLKKYIIKVKK